MTVERSSLLRVRYLIINAIVGSDKKVSMRRLGRFVLLGSRPPRSKTTPAREALLKNIIDSGAEAKINEWLALGYRIDFVIGHMKGYAFRKSFRLVPAITEPFEGDGWFLYPFLETGNKYAAN